MSKRSNLFYYTEIIWRYLLFHFLSFQFTSFMQSKKKTRSSIDFVCTWQFKLGKTTFWYEEMNNNILHICNTLEKTEKRKKWNEITKKFLALVCFSIHLPREMQNIYLWLIFELIHKEQYEIMEGNTSFNVVAVFHEFCFHSIIIEFVYERKSKER